MRADATSGDFIMSMHSSRVLAALGLTVFIVAAAACGSSEAPPADSAAAGTAPASGLDPKVTALVGARGSSGESELATLGYTAAGGRTEDGASVTFWNHAGDNGCLKVRTVDGRYESIEPATADDCAAAAAAKTTAAPAAGGYATVCGVMVEGKPVRYVCSVVDGDQRIRPTLLKFHDMEMTIDWLDATRVRLNMEGMNPIEGTWKESEGETDLVTPGQTWFYISNRDAAAMEVKSMNQK
jgi:hypothetical protein